MVGGIGIRGTLEIDSATSTSIALTSVLHDFDNNDGNAANDAGTVNKTGAGTLILGGASTYTGGTTISAGTLQVGGGGTTGSITGNIVNNAALAFNRSDAVTFAGTISGAGTLQKLGAGVLTLSAANSYAGATAIDAGTLQIGSGGTTGSITGNVVNDAALAFNRSDAVTFAGTISGTGTLQKLGAGVLTLSAANSYDGATAVDAGTLLVTGSPTGAGTITVAAGAAFGGTGTVAGAVTVTGTLSAGGTATGALVGELRTGALSFASGSTYREDIDTTARTADLVVANGVSLAAGTNDTVTLDLRATGALTSSAGQSLTLIQNSSANATTGRFTTVTNGTTSGAINTDNTFAFGGRSYRISYTANLDGGALANDITLTDVTPSPPSDPGPAGPTSGDDNLLGTAGPDTISLGLGNDTFAGGSGNDLVYGNQGNDLIYGNQDADTLYGGQGDDRAFGGQGDDRLFGNLGNDVLSGNLGNDIVYGNQGADIVYGNQGADILFGGQGNDVLYGGQGADTLVGGIGDDTLVGGLGADLYRFDPNSGRDLILGFNQGEGDRIALGGQTYTVSSAQNGDALLLLSGGGVVDLSGIRADQVNAASFAA
ncbi:MAG: autotransporter-associated beta strand repeat-containing protein [Actinomycetospora chiangmaiensis]|nr:autotransporter-associated beta strand repeat-containing protein [Actinomycetospora chiangmaiensis]